jgi:elongation factor Ts
MTEQVTVTAEMVRELRETTGVGMMECKKALVAANGDKELAIEALRKAGQATAIKKGGRIAAEGLVSVVVSADNKTAAIVEINCETDFVARQAGRHLRFDY